MFSLATIYIDFVIILNCIMNCFILNDQYLKGLYLRLSKQCAASLLDLIGKKDCYLYMCEPDIV